MGARTALLTDALLTLNIVLPTAIGNALEYVPVIVGVALLPLGAAARLHRALGRARQNHRRRRTLCIHESAHRARVLSIAAHRPSVKVNGQSLRSA